MKITELKGMPTEAGYYFVRKQNKDYWECIVNIVGTHPFLNIVSETPLFKTGDSVAFHLAECIFSEKLELTELKSKFFNDNYETKN